MALAPRLDLRQSQSLVMTPQLQQAIRLLALSNERTTILIANERRSESVQAAFIELFTPSFSFKKVPSSKMAEGYQHPAIELTILKRRCVCECVCGCVSVLGAG